MEKAFTRELDELGRLVIPKVIRQALKIESGDNLKIMTEGEKIIIQKEKKAMKNLSANRLSIEGRLFLSDPQMKLAISKIASEVGTTPEEYLLRFESVLNTDPERIFNIFESQSAFLTRAQENIQYM